jgi:hypothetical protein
MPDFRDHAFQGLIIYSFDSAAGDELIHVRSHVSTGDAVCKKERCIVCSMGWEDQAWWKGEIVPINVLGAAYAAGGVHLGGTQPARGLKMGKSGWDVLKYWDATRGW